MRVLLTGGAGYIGSHTAAELLSSGHDVVVADDLSNGDAEALRRVESLTGRNIEFHKIDVRDEPALDAVFEGFGVDSVIHFAGHKAVGESVAEPLKYYRNNLDSTFALLGSMQRHRVRKLVFSSSATVYGEPDVLPVAENALVGFGITNPYGHSKAMIEQILRDVAKSESSFEFSILRYFNPIGAHPSGRIGEDPKQVPNNLGPYVGQVAAGRRDCVAVFGDGYETPDGTGVRDYVHVCDLASGHIAALENLAPGLQTFNLGTGNGTSVLELIAMYERASGQHIPHEVVSPREGDVATSLADVTKASNVLGWTAKYSVAQACADDWRWQSNNPRGYEPNFISTSTSQTIREAE